MRLLLLFSLAAILFFFGGVEATLVTQVPREQAYLQSQRLGQDAWALVPLSSSTPAAPSDQLMLPWGPEEGDALAIQTYYDSMELKALKRVLREKQVSCHGCIERRDLVQRAMQVHHLLSHDQRIARSLAVMDSLVDPTEELPPLFVARTLHGARCSVERSNGTITCDKVVTA